MYACQPLALARKAGLIPPGKDSKFRKEVVVLLHLHVIAGGRRAGERGVDSYPNDRRNVGPGFGSRPSRAMSFRESRYLSRAAEH